MSLLKSFVAGFFEALFWWGQKQADKPKVTIDANTPKEVRDTLSQSAADWMRDQDQRRN